MSNILFLYYISPNLSNSTILIHQFSSSPCVCRQLSKSELGFNHNVVNHGSLQFVCNGSIYTNNIEGFWSHFRRMIIGCYHDVSDEHLQSYIDEACFRWNTRKMTESERFNDMFKTSIGLAKPNREFILCQKVA